MEKEILTPDHKRWEEFTERLEGKEGCNYKEGINGDLQSVTWECDGSRERPLAKKIIEKMGAFDLMGTMKYFDDHGGHCDCEILFNVVRKSQSR